MMNPTILMTSTVKVLPHKVTRSNSPCVILSENLLSKLNAQSPPHTTNHKRKRNYKSVYIVFKGRGLWHDPVYLQRKETLRRYNKDLSANYALCSFGRAERMAKSRWDAKLWSPLVISYCNKRH